MVWSQCDHKDVSSQYTMTDSLTNTCTVYTSYTKVLSLPEVRVVLQQHESQRDGGHYLFP